LPEEADRLVVNTGPLIALGRVDALDIISRLPMRFLAPVQVAEEIAAGVRLGHPVLMPTWVEVAALKAPLPQLSVSTLDEGEAAVIQLALELGVARVGIDEWRLTRVAAQLWSLDIANHRGRWEPTPFRASLEEVVSLVADTFPWTLQPVHYPERTSDREH
jgi:predicted nucleic acid-binding protein